MKKLPVIDFAKCGLLIEQDCEIDRKDIVNAGKQLYEAFSTHGFAYISNHGIKRDKIDAVNEVADKFFALPLEQKMKYANKGTPNEVIGSYEPFGVLHVNPEREFDYQEGFRLSGGYWNLEGEVWPDVPNFKETMTEVMEHETHLALRVLKALGAGMKLKDPEHFCKRHQLINQKGNISMLKAVKYPPILDDKTLAKNQIRIGEHTDGGSVTLLFQDDVGGLQIEDSDGNFVDVPPIAGAAVVNIGDCLQFWSGNRLKSTVHRVIPPTDPEKRLRTRRSVVYFASPDDDALLEELEFENSQQSSQPTSKPPMKTSEFIAKRFLDYYPDE